MEIKEAIKEIQDLLGTKESGCQYKLRDALKTLLSLAQRVEEIIKVYDDYIILLGKELDELAPFAATHGWKSSRFEEGKKMREKITAIRNHLKGGE